MTKRIRGGWRATSTVPVPLVFLHYCTHAPCQSLHSQVSFAQEATHLHLYFHLLHFHLVCITLLAYKLSHTKPFHLLAPPGARAAQAAGWDARWPNPESRNNPTLPIGHPIAASPRACAVIATSNAAWRTERSHGDCCCDQTSPDAAEDEATTPALCADWCQWRKVLSIFAITVSYLKAGAAWRETPSKFVGHGCAQWRCERFGSTDQQSTERAAKARRYSRTTICS